MEVDAPLDGVDEQTAGLPGRLGNTVLPDPPERLPRPVEGGGKTGGLHVDAQPRHGAAPALHLDPQDNAAPENADRPGAGHVPLGRPKAPGLGQAERGPNKAVDLGQAGEKTFLERAAHGESVRREPPPPRPRPSSGTKHVPTLSVDVLCVATPAYAKGDTK